MVFFSHFNSHGSQGLKLPFAMDLIQANVMNGSCVWLCNQVAEGSRYKSYWWHCVKGTQRISLVSFPSLYHNLLQWIVSSLLLPLSCLFSFLLPYSCYNYSRLKQLLQALEQVTHLGLEHLVFQEVCTTLSLPLPRSLMLIFGVCRLAARSDSSADNGFWGIIWHCSTWR